MISPAVAVLIVLGVFAVAVLALLVGREVVLWYFKINETLSVLKNIDENLWAIRAKKPLPDEAKQ